MQKLIKISMSPNNSNVETFENMVMKVSGSYSENNVTIQFNPNIVHHQEKPSDNIRQFTITQPTADTKVIAFDFSKNNIHKIQIENNSFEIKLMTIGKEMLEGQNFLYFEFLVTKI